MSQTGGTMKRITIFTMIAALETIVPDFDRP